MLLHLTITERIIRQLREKPKENKTSLEQNK